MAGKKSGGKQKNKKKKGKKGDGSLIAAGIMPTAMFAAVPRTPPPPKESPDFGVGINSALLNSSMLTRMFASPDIPDDNPLSDTDTSLFDYDRRNVESVEHGYSMVEFNRDPMPTPPDEFRDDGLQREYEDIMAQQSNEPLYSSVKKKRTVDYDVDDAHSSLGRHSLHGSGRSRRSGNRTPIFEDKVEAQMVERRQMSSPGEVAESYSHTESPKLLSLKEQNLQLLKQQQVIQGQLEEQQQLQQQMMMRLQEKGMMASQQLGEDEMTTLLQDTQTVTDRATERQTTLVRALNARADVLQEQNNELQDLNEQLQAEILSLRRLTSYKEDDEMASTQTSHLKKQLLEYKDENNALKSAIARLNGELSRYQAKFRPLSAAEKDELPGLPNRGPKPPWLINHRYLAPLFLSYDDQMKEKDIQLTRYHEEMDDLRVRVDEVVKENQRLHLRIEQSDISGPTSMTEWRQLQEQCKLVLEENQLLMEQLDVQQNKGKDMHTAHIQEVAKLSQRLVSSEAEKHQLDSEVGDLRDKFSVIKKEHDSVVVENRGKLAVEEHLNQVNELKRTLEDIKAKDSQEIDILKDKIKMMEIEKKGLATQMENVKSDREKLAEELHGQHKSERKNMKKLLLLQKAVEDAEIKEQTAEHYLGSLVRVAEETAAERDTYAQAMEKEQKQKKVAINRLMTGSLTIGQMEEKLKIYKSKAAGKLEKAANRIKDQDEDFNRQRQEYEREVRHLRLLLQEKDEILRSMSGDKRQIEANLETLWQVASADNRRMKDDAQKSIHRLEGHCRSSIRQKDDYDIFNNSDHELLLTGME